MILGLDRSLMITLYLPLVRAISLRVPQHEMVEHNGAWFTRPFWPRICGAGIIGCKKWVAITLRAALTMDIQLCCRGWETLHHDRDCIGQIGPTVLTARSALVFSTKDSSKICLAIFFSCPGPGTWCFSASNSPCSQQTQQCPEGRGSEH